MAENNNQHSEICFNINSNNFEALCENREAQQFLIKNLKRITKTGAKKLLRLLLKSETKIHIADIKTKYVGFLQYNKSRFTDEKLLTEETIMWLQKSVLMILNKFFGEDLLEEYSEELDGKIKTDIGEVFYIVNKNTSYGSIRATVCDEPRTANFKYFFDKADMEPVAPQTKNTVQRFLLQITSTGVVFDYPIAYSYTCTRCGKTTKKALYKSVCTNGKIDCEGFYNYINQNGESKTKMCWKSLSPDDNLAEVKACYYYLVSYEDILGNKKAAAALSFNNYKPGYYDVVGIQLKNPKGTRMFHILDVKEIGSTTFILPSKVITENYIFTLQRAFDMFIKEQTGMEIYGLYPIKVALILQAILSALNEKPIYNVQIVGDASTGKSIILKYYGYLLYNSLYLSTNGLSVSIPALRGTRTTINLMGKDANIVTLGYLGTFNAIHIDEAGENRELVQNLKTFIYDFNYGYDKAGGEGTQKVRTAHINLSENLDHGHLGQYIGMIRKAYKNLNIQIGNEEKLDWNETWELHQPIHEYTNNPYLYKIIKEKREEYRNQKKFWIDGYDYAIHERFPFYFYLVNSKDNNNELINAIRGNVARGTIEENTALMGVLKSDDIWNFFKGLKNISENTDTNIVFGQVDDIVNSYGIEIDSRKRTFYYSLVQISKRLNNRKTAEKEDFDLLRWFLEKTNCKLSVNKTADYKINGPPNLEETKTKELEFEDTTTKIKEGVGNMDFSMFDNDVY